MPRRVLSAGADCPLCSSCRAPTVCHSQSKGLITWVGNKQRISKYIQALAPPHSIRVIPFAGSLGELWGWEYEGVEEIAGDIDWRIINLWKVCQSCQLVNRLLEELLMCPCARVEVLGAKATCAKKHYPRIPDVGLAKDLVVLTRWSQSCNMLRFLTMTIHMTCRMSSPISGYINALARMGFIHKRIKNIKFLCQDAFDTIKQFDNKDAFIYCDPPYIGTREDAPYSNLELQNQSQHEKLLSVLLKSQAKIMISSYPNELYESVLGNAGWKKFSIKVPNNIIRSMGNIFQKNKYKTEVLWMNYEPVVSGNPI